MLDSLETESSDLSEEVADLTETTETTEEAQEESVETEEEAGEGEAEELVYDIRGKQVTQAELDEAYDSGLRSKDYTQKTMAHAEEVKALKVKQEDLSAKLSQFDGMETELNDLVMSEFSDVDMNELRETDTSEYLRVRDSREDRSKALSSLIAKRDQLQRQQIADEQTQLFDSRGWNDSAVKDKEIASFNKFAASNGFTDSDIQKLTSSRIMSALLDAAKFSDLKESADGKKVKPVTPKTAKPRSVKQPAAKKSMAERMFGNTSPS